MNSKPPVCPEVAEELLGACRNLLTALETKGPSGELGGLSAALARCHVAVDKADLDRQSQRLRERWAEDAIRFGPPLAYAYLRVSHENSRVSGLSPAAQLRGCRIYYEQHLQDQAVAWYGLEKLPPDLELRGYDPEIPLFYDPAVSARRVPFLNRQAGSALHARLKPGDHVIFAHLDRSIRQVLDHAGLMRIWLAKRIGIHYADLNIDVRTPQGQLVSNVMAAVAQAQSDFISERTKEGLAESKARGLPRNHGGPARRGWKYVRAEDGRLRQVPDQETRRIFEYVRYLHEVEGRKLPQIAEIVERKIRKEEGYPDWETLPPEPLRRWPPKRLQWLYYRMKWDGTPPAEPEVRIRWSGRC